MARPKIEMSIERDGIDVVTYPFVESDHVVFENGMDIDTMIREDVATPVVTHEETSFKVGKGDSDVSGSIVDSSISEMTIKGQTYQNILPDPSLQNNMNNGKSMQKINEGYDSVNVVDGIAKSAILSGNTLVNLHPKRTYQILANTTQYFTNITSEENNASVKFNGGSLDWCYGSGGVIDKSLFKPLTKYLVVFDKTENAERVALCDGGGVSFMSNWGYLTNNRTILTTVSTFPTNSEIVLYVRHDGITAGETFQFSNAMIIEYQEGMENWDIPYFEGMTSCKVPVLHSTGKNLFDGAISKGYLTDATGQSNNQLGVHSTNYMKCSPNSTYVISGTLNDLTPRFYFYDSGKSYLGYEVGTNGYKKFTAPSNARYMRFRLFSNEQHDVALFNAIQVEESSSETSYELYKSNILSATNIYDGQMVFNRTVDSSNGTIAPDHYVDRMVTQNLLKVIPDMEYSISTNMAYGGLLIATYTSGQSFIQRLEIGAVKSFTVPSDCHYVRISFTNVSNLTLDYLEIVPNIVLRSLPNGVRDTYNVVTKEYVQRIGEVVLNGGETEWRSATANGKTHYHLVSSLLFDGVKGHGKYLNCDKYATGEVGKTWSEHSVPSVTTSNANACQIGFTFADGVFASVEEFKNSLQSNPVTVQYELATPVVKTVDLSSSGNWEKVVLDGSESSWTKENVDDNIVRFKLGNVYGSMRDGSCVCDTLPCYVRQDIANVDYVRSSIDLIWVYQKDTLQTVEQFKSKLQQKPITVWYQTTASQANSIKEMLSFADGHIQLSSGVGEGEYSLIPSIDYEVPTSNSYHMDLMKADTNYTVKSTNPNGTCDIGDMKGITIPSNYLWNVPSARKGNMLLVVHGSWTNPMILEGDLTSKALPYFKGIKSAFEDDSKIEVLSTGKNLFDGELQNGYIYNFTNGQLMESKQHSCSKKMTKVKGGETYHLSVYSDKSYHIVFVYQYDNNKNHLKSNELSSFNGKHIITLLPSTSYVHLAYTYEDSSFTMQLEESSNSTPYESYKSNNTKIPLLSSSSNIEMEYGNFNEVGEESPHNDMKRCVDYLKISKHTNHIELLNNNKYEWFHLYLYDENKKFISVQFSHSMAMDGVSLPIDKKAKFFRFSTTPFLGDFEVKQIYFNESRSLPNGVRDEIILDRENSKAKIIQRVGKVVLDGSENWTLHSINSYGIANFSLKFTSKENAFYVCDRFASTGDIISVAKTEGILNGGVTMYIRMNERRCNNATSFKKWLSQNPTTVYYELATPIITEIDLEGFPYVYKDGHIFMNGEIAPTTTMKYSINQSHQIEAQNSDVIRHQKEIDYLYTLIAQYVNVQYESTLLSLDLELSRA